MRSDSFSIDGPKGRNQDRRLCPSEAEGGWIAAIADGVGGNDGGEVAAEAAIQAVSRYVPVRDQSMRDLFVQACDLIASSADRYPKMATTLSVLAYRDGVAHVGHVGDTRIYHVRGRGIVTRTVDQTEVALLVRQGVLSPNQAKRYPRKNVISSYLSSAGEFDLYEETFSVEVGDYLFLLTDGVYDILKKSDIVEICLESGNISDISRKMEGFLRDVGVADDSTVIAIEI